jgi:FlaA1/EpsC-like NDP-sugar epimerase
MNLTFLRNRHFFILDALALSVTPFLALLLRTEKGSDLSCFFSNTNTQNCFFVGLVTYTVLALAIRLAVFYGYGLYSRYWRYASVDEMSQIFFAVATSSLIIIILFFIAYAFDLPFLKLPRSVPFIDAMLVMIYLGGSRFSLRFAVRWRRIRPKENARRVAIMGAGDAGAMIVRELQNNPQVNMVPVAFFDDDLGKHDVRIHGIPVLGNRQSIAEGVRSLGIDLLIIAMPTAPGKTIREIVEICEAVQLETKITPGMYEVLDDTVSVSQLRDVDIKDLLRREPVRIDTATVAALLANRRVLVTGSGGSIGSELCRQIMACAPAQLILLGHGENSIFDIYHELRRLQMHKESPTVVQAVIADIRFPGRLADIFNQYRPEVVFHTAAHKHVPLMELNPVEAVSNNILGTQNVIKASLQHHVEHFVMISTDKAVNPTGMMGASKRAAELLVHAAAVQSENPYVAVRFGNVLGSRGSVVLTFKEQIAAGGPVTVTHPEMKRYFMTIPEAVQLVLQAAVLGRGGEVFVLDMGEPVRIEDLARDLIELSGLEVGQDIEIVYTGMRPGEKLFEELFVQGEAYERTRHEKIFIAANADTLVPDQLQEHVADLTAAAERNDGEAIRRLLQALIPEFRPLTDAPPTPANFLRVDPATHAPRHQPDHLPAG